MSHTGYQRIIILMVNIIHSSTMVDKGELVIICYNYNELLIRSGKLLMVRRGQLLAWLLRDTNG